MIPQRHNATIAIALLLVVVGQPVQPASAQKQSSPRSDFLQLIDRGRVPLAAEVTALRLVDRLQTRADVDGARIGMIGISKGGIETYLTAAVDPRVAIAVPVIGVQSFRWALEHNAWQPRVETIPGAVVGAARDGLRPVDATFVQDFYDRVVPGIYEEFDGPAMLPLVAPRPLLVVNGDSDVLTPLAGVQEAATAAERAYRSARAPEKFRLLVQPDTGHEFTPAAQRTALDWLVRWLKP